MNEASLCAGALVCSLVSCEIIRRFAARRALLDAPNDRSLHTTPTPRLGGVAIVLTTVLASVAFIPMSREVAWLLAAGAVMSVLGLVDDVRPLTAAVRFPLQIAVAGAFVWLATPESLLLLPHVPLAASRALVMCVLVVWSVGTLNIYNFMDGMDGLAGAQALSASLALAFLFTHAGARDLAATSALLAAASTGFLAHNFPPARIFMGDAGSTFIGLFLAALAVLGTAHGIPLAVTALPLSPFLLDGTFTLFRRALRGERVWKAHRSHLYQRAVQTGLGHREVLLVYAGWMTVCVGLAPFAERSAAACLAAWGVSVVVLVGLWRWVVSRESKR